MNIIDPSQLKTVIESVCEKSKTIFATKKSLAEEVANLNSMISALEARVTSLEAYHTTPEVNGEDEEPEPEEPNN